MRGEDSRAFAFSYDYSGKSNMEAFPSGKMPVPASKFFIMKIFLAIVISVFLISTFQTVKAAEDFVAISSYSEFSLCTCTSARDSVIISNTGTSKSSYAVTASGENKEWSSYLPSEFSLMPGESRTVIHSINPPCGTTGTKTIATRMTTSAGTAKEFKQKVQLSNCQNLDVYILNRTISACSCTPKEFLFVVRNSGQYPESYDLKLSPIMNASLDKSSLLLKPGESATIKATIQPNCLATGLLNYSLEVKAKTSKYLARAPITFSSRQCNDFSFVDDAPLYLKACSEFPTNISIPVINSGEKENTFYAALSGAPWASIAMDSLSLAGSQSGTFDISLNPGESAQKNSNRELMLKVSNSANGIVKDKKVFVNTTRCLGIKISMPDNRQAICCGVNYFEFAVNNTGIVPADFLLNASGYGWLEARQAKQQLEPGQSSGALLVLNAPCQDKSYDLQIKASILAHEDVNDLALLKLDVRDQNSCYALEAANNRQKIYLGNSSQLTFAVKNTGLKSARYLVSLEDVPYWVKLNTAIIAVNPSEETSLTLTAMPNSTVPQEKYLMQIRFDVLEDGSNATYVLPFYINLKEKYGLWKRSAALAQKYSGGILIALAILIGLWLLNKLYVNHKEKQLTQKIIEDQARDRENARLARMAPMARRKEKVKMRREKKEAEKRSSESSTHILRFIRFGGIVLVIVLALLLVAVYFRQNWSRNFQTTTPMEDISMVLSDIKDFVIRPLTSAGNASGFQNISSEQAPPIQAQGPDEEKIPDLPIAEEQDESFTFHRMKKGETLEVDLAQYFHDPDDDNLVFSVQAAPQLKAGIDGNIVKLTAVEEGRAKVVYTATDSHGLSVSSPEVTFIIN